MRISSPYGNSIPFTEVWLCTLKISRSQHRRQLGLPSYRYTRGWGLQSTKKEGSPFGMVNRTGTSSTATTKQEFLRSEIPTDEEQSPSHLRTSEKAGPPKGQWRDAGRGCPGLAELLGEYRLSRILRSGVLLKWDSLPSLTRTPRQFPTKSKTQDLQKAVTACWRRGP